MLVNTHHLCLQCCATTYTHQSTSVTGPTPTLTPRRSSGGDLTRYPSFTVPGYTGRLSSVHGWAIKLATLRADAGNDHYLRPLRTRKHVKDSKSDKENSNSCCKLPAPLKGDLHGTVSQMVCVVSGECVCRVAGGVL